MKPNGQINVQTLPNSIRVMFENVPLMQSKWTENKVIAHWAIRYLTLVLRHFSVKNIKS